MRDTNREPKVVYLVGERVDKPLKGKLNRYKGTFKTKRKAIDACTDLSLTYYEIENNPETIARYVPDLPRKVKSKGGTTILKTLCEIKDEDD